MINFWQRKPRFNNNAAAIDRIAGVSITYGELHTLAESINIMLPREKQLVALLWTNSIHCLAGYISALKSGHAILLLDGTAPAISLYPLLQTYMPNYVWKPQNWGRPNVKLGKEYSLMPFNEVAIDLNPDLALLLPLPEAGESGLMRFSYESLQHQAESIAEFIDVKEVDKVLQLVPYFSITGLGLLNACIHRGSCQAFIAEDYSLEERNTLFDDFKPTLLITDRDSATSNDALEASLTSVTQFVIVDRFGNNFVLPPWLNEKAQDFKATIQIIFQIPAIGVVSGMVLGSAFESSLAVGSPLPLTRLDVLDTDNGTKIKQSGIQGNLLLRSIGIPYGPATEVADLQLTDVFEGKLNLNCSGYFTESGLYIIAR
jgi:hypothetical protein